MYQFFWIGQFFKMVGQNSFGWILCRLGIFLAIFTCFMTWTAWGTPATTFLRLLFLLEQIHGMCWSSRVRLCMLLVCTDLALTVRCSLFKEMWYLFLLLFAGMPPWKPEFGKVEKTFHTVEELFRSKGQYDHKMVSVQTIARLLPLMVGFGWECILVLFGCWV